MLKSLLVACLVIMSQSAFAAQKTVSVEEVVGYLSVLNNKSKSLSDLAKNISFTKEKQQEYLTFLKNKKLEKQAAVNVKVSGMEMALVGSNIKISFQDLKSGFIKVNGKTVQVLKGESLDTTHSKIMAILTKKAFIRSLFFEEAFAADSLQSSGAAAGILVNSAKSVYDACTLAPTKDSNSSTVTLCQFFDSSKSLLDLFPQQEFPIDFTCEGKSTVKKTSFMSETKEIVYDMPRSLVTASGVTLTFDQGASRSGTYEYTMKENGVVVCSVRNPQSYQINSNVVLVDSLGGKYTSEACSTIFQATFNCCRAGDSCLNKLADYTDKEKAERLYQLKNYNEQEAILPSPLTPTKGIR